VGSYYSLAKRPTAGAWDVHGDCGSILVSNTSRTGITSGFSEFATFEGDAPLAQVPLVLQAVPTEQQQAIRLSWQASLARGEVLALERRENNLLPATNLQIADQLAESGTLEDDEVKISTPYFYRLVVSQPDGQVRKGAWVEARLGAGATDVQIQAYPNPVQSLLNVAVQVAQTAPVEICIFSPNGREVYRGDYAAAAGANLYQLPVGQLNAGAWLLQVKCQGQLFHKTFIRLP
jgi:hypothetical protein